MVLHALVHARARRQQLGLYPAPKAPMLTVPDRALPSPLPRGHGPDRVPHNPHVRRRARARSPDVPHDRRPQRRRERTGSATKIHRRSEEGPIPHRPALPAQALRLRGHNRRLGYALHGRRPLDPADARR